MDTVHSLLKAIQAPYFTLSLYAPIAWSKSHSQPSPPQHRRTSSSWQIATFPAYLRDYIAQRQRCVLSLREKILTTAALASVHPAILCPPCSPSTSLASSMNFSPDGQPLNSSVDSLIASQHASADHLLQGLFLYDAIQAKLASVAASEQDSHQKSHLSTLLSPLLESMSAYDLQRLLIAVRALHHTLRAHLHCVLNSGEDDFLQDFDENDDMVEPNSAVDSGYDTELPSMHSFSPAFSPPYTKGKIKRSVTSDISDLSSSKTTYSAADFKIDGWLRLGANSVLAILNMCSGACPFLEAAEKQSTLAVSSHATSSPIPFTERKPSNASLQSMGITISAEDKEMVRECLDRYVDTTACASRRNGSTIGSTSFNGHGCCGDEDVHSHEDGKCEWERVIEKVLAQKR